MKAKYFRLMYQNVGNGIIHNVSVADTGSNEKWNVCYLCGMKKNQGPMDLDERFRKHSEPIDLLVVASLDEYSIDTALQLVCENDVRKIILPSKGVEEGQMEDKFLAKGADRVVELTAGDTVIETGAGWNVKLAVYGKGTDATIVMFHDTQKVLPEEEDCVLTVKPSRTGLPCSACIDGENHNCAMRCGLYNDYDVCKGHSGKDSSGYVTGTLLLGNVNLKEYGDSIRNTFLKKEDTVRFTALADSGCDQNWEPGLLETVDTDNENVSQYYILQEAEMDEKSEVLKKILLKGPRHIPILTSQKYGLCASGFFKKR